MRRVAIVAILAGFATIPVVLVVAAKPDGVLATVGGFVISRTAYDQYAQVFTSPEGDVRVSEEDILLSLVNQALVQAAADRRGLEVSDSEVSLAVDGMSEADPIGQSLPKGGDEAAFRERVRMFLLFRLVQSEVVGPIDIPDVQIEAAYAADPSLHVLGYQDAIPVLRERLASRESEDRWLAWLKGQRRCAEIRILDASFDIPSSTPSPECGGADG